MFSYPDPGHVSIFNLCLLIGNNQIKGTIPVNMTYLVYLKTVMLSKSVHKSVMFAAFDHFDYFCLL